MPPGWRDACALWLGSLTLPGAPAQHNAQALVGRGVGCWETLPAVQPPLVQPNQRGIRDALAGKGGRLPAITGGRATTQPSATVAADHPSPLPHPRSSQRAPDEEVCYHFFAGDEADRSDGTAAYAAAWGVPMIEEDKAIGGWAHDWFNDEVFDHRLARARQGLIRYAHAGFPCWTFTRLLIMSGILRDDSHPNGVDGLSADKRAKVNYADALLRRLILLFTAIFDAGGDFSVEQPGPTSNPDLISFLAGSRKHFDLTRMPEFIRFMEYTGALWLVYYTCAIDDLGPKKPVILIGTRLVIKVLRPLDGRGCPHPEGWVHPRLTGRGTDGKRRSEKSAKYCAALCWWLARVAAVCFTGRDPLDEGTGEGELAFGRRLHPSVRAAVESARRAPPKFASHRRTAAVPREDRWRLAMPAPHAEVAETTRVTAPAATHDWAVTLDGPDDERPESWPAGAARPPRAAHGIPGAPPGPIHAEQVWRRRPEDGNRRTGWLAMCAWRDAAAAAMRAIARGEPYDDVEDVVLYREWKEDWAKDILIDQRDPTDVVRGRRSTRQTIFPGDQMDAAAFRAAAADVAWDEVDADILSQGGEGGLETRSACERVTTLIFNHKGAAEFFAEADAVIREEFASSWITGVFDVCPPWEPCRSLPRNVAMQSKLKVDAITKEVSYKPKPRVTTNGSAQAKKGTKRGREAEVEGLNDGVPDDESAVALPPAQMHAAGAAVIDACCLRAHRRAPERQRIRAGQYASDKIKAYRYCNMQRADHWSLCFFWILRMPDGTIRVGWFIDGRLFFGGSYGPNRFERIAKVGRARARRTQREFDAAHPYPPELQAVVEERAALVDAGVIHGGDEQKWLAYMQAFIDDDTGSAPADIVQLRPAWRWLRHIDLRLAPLTDGARPFGTDTRVAYHCAIEVHTTQSLGFGVATKTQLGDGITVLGLRCDVRDDRLDCPPSKAAVIIHTANELCEHARQGSAFPQRAAETLVGRAINQSQAYPSMLSHLHAGYRLARVPRRYNGARAASIKLKPGSQLAEDVATMASDIVRALEEEEGVPLIFEPWFPETGAAGSLVATTDASLSSHELGLAGDDGFGGFVFEASHPHEIFISHAAWTDGPPGVLAALRNGQLRSHLRDPDAPTCSMPVAETFGTWAVTHAASEFIARRLGGRQPPTSVTAVTDCKPSASCITSATSKSPVLQRLLPKLREHVSQWMGVHVLRGLNTDADRLSHPSMVAAVIAAAEAAGLRVHIAPIPRECWDALLEAITQAHNVTHVRGR